MKHKDKEQPNTEKEHKQKKDSIESLYAEIEQLQKEKDELFGKLQRVSADYANFQKRSARQITDSIAYEKEMIIKTLLPVLDNFEHTLQNVEGAENVDALIKGVKIIYDQMLDILKSHGVEQTKALGEQFDPNLHEAMMRQTDEQQEDNIILEEFQKGYKLNGRTIRPSKVIVNKLQFEQPYEQEDDPEDFPEETEGDENQFDDVE